MPSTSPRTLPKVRLAAGRQCEEGFVGRDSSQLLKRAEQLSQPRPRTVGAYFVMFLSELGRVQNFNKQV